MTKATSDSVRQKLRLLARGAETTAGDCEGASRWREAADWRLISQVLKGMAEWPALPLQLSLLEPDAK